MKSQIVIVISTFLSVVSCKGSDSAQKSKLIGRALSIYNGQKKIINRVTMSPEMHKAAASLVSIKSHTGEHMSSGALISKQRVLTVADHVYKLTRPDFGGLVVWVQIAYDRNGGKPISIADVDYDKTYPAYSSSEFALIELTQELTLSHSISVIHFSPPRVVNKDNSFIIRWDPCIRKVVIIHPSIIVDGYFHKIPVVDVAETDINVLRGSLLITKGRLCAMGMQFENVTDDNGHKRLHEAYRDITPYDTVIMRAMPENLKLDPQRHLMKVYSNWMEMHGMNSYGYE